MRPRRKYISCLVAFAILSACNGGSKPAENTTGNITMPPGETEIPAAIPYEVINVYPHDPHAFTEGLEYHNGHLYESTGQYKHSDIRTTDLKTGKVLTSQQMKPQYFGEGLTVLNGKVYQITYREHTGFIYDTGSLKEVQTFRVDANEGWGMTNDGTYLIFDDGSNVFHFLDPKTFKEVKRLRVRDEHGPLMELNEPEMIHGYIYANVWRTDVIVKIDTSTGRVVGRVDLGGLREQMGIPATSRDPSSPEVMNGIAYDAAGNRIFITGKNWPKLIEIKLDN